jgi:hypothetical protein
MPPCDHVLYLKNGACDRNDARHAVFLLATVKDGVVTRVEGTAPGVVKSWYLTRHDLRVEGGRLTGAVTILHRPDRWSWPLVETGRLAAARYVIDVDPTKPEKAGTFTGTWGVGWEDRRRVVARLVPDTP